MTTEEMIAAIAQIELAVKQDRLEDHLTASERQQVQFWLKKAQMILNDEDLTQIDLEGKRKGYL